MGSLRAVKYKDLGMKPGDDVKMVVKKKPLQNLLGVFKQVEDPNRSPLGSPPVEKKRLKRLSNQQQGYKLADNKENMPQGNISLNMYQFSGKTELQQPQGPQSILKKTVRPTCILYNERPRCSHNRKLTFNGSVKVQYIGEKDIVMEPLVSEEHQDRQGFIARNALRRMHPAQDIQYCSYVSGSENLSSTNQQPSFHNSTSLPISSSSESPLTSKNVNISFMLNNRGSKSMKFVVFMGPQYDPANIVVKANMSGNRLRVVANLMKGVSGQCEQYNERFQLPQQVDPYKVEARLDGRGYLTVTAPVIDQTASSISV